MRRKEGLKRRNDEIPLQKDSERAVREDEWYGVNHSTAAHAFKSCITGEISAESKSDPNSLIAQPRMVACKSISGSCRSAALLLLERKARTVYNRITTASSGDASTS